MASTKRKQMRSALIAGCIDTLDVLLAEEGFKRRSNSLKFSKKLDASIQNLELRFELSPLENRNAIASVYPHMEVLIPQVDAIFDKMIEDRLWAMEGVTGGRLRQPIEITSPSRRGGKWFVFNLQEVSAVSTEIAQFLSSWTLPFLSEYERINDVLTIHNNDDQRVIRDRANLLRVACAALALNDKALAKGYLDDGLGLQGAIRMYSPVYQFIDDF